MRRQVYIDCGAPCRPFEADEAVVVVDVIRSTTTAITAVALGRRCLPVPSVAAAFARACGLSDPLLVGELGGAQSAGFELTNSPALVARRTDVWRPMILLSSSGTPLIDRVQHASAVYLACLRNYRSVAEHVRRRHTRVTVLGAPTRGEFREEDQMCCGLIAETLLGSGFAVGDRDTAACVERWSGAPPDAFLRSKSVAYLRATGQLRDLEFILGHFDDLRGVYALDAGEVVAVPAPTDEPRP
jgi:2-phosphosulfolactate phosphatase